MIHVLTYPDRWIDWLRYQIWGTMPSVSGEDLRSGAGMVEIINGDTCTMIPAEAVMHIYFDSGYQNALARVRQEANENIAARLGGMPLDDEPPYDAAAAPPMKPDDARDFG